MHCAAPHWQTPPRIPSSLWPVMNACTCISLTSEGPASPSTDTSCSPTGTVDICFYSSGTQSRQSKDEGERIVEEGDQVMVEHWAESYFSDFISIFKPENLTKNWPVGGQAAIDAFLFSLRKWNLSIEIALAQWSGLSSLSQKTVGPTNLPQMTCLSKKDLVVVFIFLNFSLFFVFFLS